MSVGKANAAIEDMQPSDQEVIAFLSAHPDFLNEHPELLETLTPPARRKGEGVLDMQQFAIDKLREQIEMVRKINDELILASRDNMSAQSQVHEAVLHFLECASLDELMEIVRVDLARIFDVDVARLCLEMDIGPDGAVNESGIMALEPGAVDRMLGAGRSVRLEPETDGDAVVFGSEAGLVRSAVLVRIRVDARGCNGLLAFGVRTRGRFYPGQGTELLTFLGRIVEIALENCMDEA